MHVVSDLQWGGRFAQPPDPQLIAFGSSLEDDLVLAPFDVRCSRAHVTAQLEGGVIERPAAEALQAALDFVADEIGSGAFERFARAGAFEDVHGAIDARVRELAPEAGEALHAGRSRNDQVATTLLLYVRDRAESGLRVSSKIARRFLDLAQTALDDRTLLAATTHWQPAQPVLLAFWLLAASAGFERAGRRFAGVAEDALRFAPLGSGALAGSSLPLERDAAARELGFREPSRNALDAVGDRDVALDLLHAAARAVITASRPSEELIVWMTPAFGYAKLGDAAATGSSLMPQKRNPDPFELVRAAAASALGTLTGALASVKGLGLSYHRDLQETKALVIGGTERALAALGAFDAALAHVTFDHDAMTAAAARGFTVATDAADALIARGIPARSAHRFVGEVVAASGSQTFGQNELEVLRANTGLSDLKVPLDPLDSVAAKRTSGSTNPSQIAKAIATARSELDALERRKG
ncbi:MAG: argininosuccinate lyase [Candidatus Eremiobacteraeota bacterium]|nr:argininosuccinate lyase [Candidatus Eremiobacteraeota bacterium]